MASLPLFILCICWQTTGWWHVYAHITVTVKIYISATKSMRITRSDFDWLCIEKSVEKAVKNFNCTKINKIINITDSPDLWCIHTSVRIFRENSRYANRGLYRLVVCIWQSSAWFLHYTCYCCVLICSHHADYSAAFFNSKCIFRARTSIMLQPRVTLKSGSDSSLAT